MQSAESQSWSRLTIISTTCIIPEPSQTTMAGSGNPFAYRRKSSAESRIFSCRAAAPSMAGRVGPASAGPVPVGRFPPPRRSAARRGKRERTSTALQEQ